MHRPEVPIRKNNARIKTKKTMHPFIKLSEDIKAKIDERLKSSEFSDFLKKANDADENETGTFEVIISTDDLDRQGESVDQNGIDLTYYRMNPVVLWAHDYSSLPIGTCTDIRIEGGKTIAKGKFASMAANPFAQQVRKLYDEGIVRATSVGFIPLEYDAKNRDLITKSELLEFSFVPVPANPHALSLARLNALKIDMGMLAMKGLDFDKIIREAEVKGAQPGARCEMDDGTPGVLAKDPKDPDGALVCVPKEQKSEEGSMVEAAISDYREKMSDEHARHAGMHSRHLDEFAESMAKGMVDDSIDVAKVMKAHKDLKEKVELENQTHSKRSAKHSEKLIKAFDTGEDVGGNPTADGQKAVTVKEGDDTLSEGHMEKVKKALEHIKNAAAALGDITSPERGDNDEDDHKAADESLASKDLNVFLAGRDILKEINTMTADVLKDFNIAIRQRKS